MKRFISKVKKATKDFFTNKSAFSLVELIVVIAIMAVLAAVLAPALLGYVERSRAQKDTSAMSEIVNSVQLSLADQDVYDEMLKYSVEQYSCYVDSDSPDEANKVDIKAGKYYMYNDNERQLDETVYKLDGVMRGVTITFAPDAAASNSATLDLIKGHVNKYLPSGKKTYGGLTGADASPKLADIPESELYNSLRATIGDKIAISSQTYRNSEYTVFISMGTTGGNEAAMQDAIKVWGQFSGTNLPEGSSVAGNGANAGTSAGSNEFQEPTGSLQTSTELTTLTVKSWEGLTNFYSSGIWTDNNNIYYSDRNQQYVLIDGKWEKKIWQNRPTYLSGIDIWSDGVNVYYIGEESYVLRGDTWEKTTWESTLSPNIADGIWTDGEYTYYSTGYTHLVYRGDKWEEQSWNGLTEFNGFDIFMDGTNVYYSYHDEGIGTIGDYILNKATKTWEPITAEELPSTRNSFIWSDGVNTYYSQGSEQYVLKNGIWEPKTWNGMDSFNAFHVWTDGTNYYLSSGSKQYIFS